MTSNNNEQVLSEEVIQALIDCYNLSIDRTVRARIPECGDFAAIAQNLGYVLDKLGIMKD